MPISPALDNLAIFISSSILGNKLLSCYNSNYRGIIKNYKHVLPTCSSLLFSIIFELYLSIILL